MRQLVRACVVVLALAVVVIASPALAVELPAGTAEIGVALPLSAPVVGYFIADNVEIAAALSFISGEMEDADVSVMAFAVTGRYYFTKVSLAGLVPFADAGYQRLGLEIEGEDTSASRLFLGGGVKYFLTDKVALEGSAHYNTGSLELGGSDADLSGFQLGAGFTVFVR